MLEPWFEVISVMPEWIVIVLNGMSLVPKMIQYSHDLDAGQKKRMDFCNEGDKSSKKEWLVS